MTLYGFLFFGWGGGISLSSPKISSAVFVVAGILFAFVNSIATSIISDQVSDITKRLPLILRVGIPLTVALITLFLSILLALMNA